MAQVFQRLGTGYQHRRTGGQSEQRIDVPAVETRCHPSIDMYLAQSRAAPGQFTPEYAAATGRADQGDTATIEFTDDIEREQAFAVLSLRRDMRGDVVDTKRGRGALADRDNGRGGPQGRQLRGEADGGRAGEDHQFIAERGEQRIAGSRSGDRAQGQTGYGDRQPSQRTHLPHQWPGGTRGPGDHHADPGQRTAGWLCGGRGICRHSQECKTSHDILEVFPCSTYLPVRTQARQTGRLMTIETLPPLHELERFVLDGIPLARAMDLRIAAYDGRSLSMTAPLEPNINDKGCAFGGSMASLMTLTCWALVEQRLREHGFDCDVFVGESTVRYFNPVWEDLRAEATLAPGASWDTFFATLTSRRRARAEIECVIPGAGAKPDASLSARFVAKRRD
jgi:thioesterase domain-containing protein